MLGGALWVRWALANAVGWGIGGIAGRMAAALIGTTVGATWGTAAAALERGGGPGSLLFAVVAAMIVALAMGAGGVAVGAIVGLMQARVVGPHLRSPVHWVAGWSLAGLAASASATPATLDQGFASGWELRRITNNLAGLVIFGLVGGSVGGGITGTVLVRLLRPAGK